jgi:OmpA-OmpF porin, OOP family
MNRSITGSHRVRTFAFAALALAAGAAAQAQSSSPVMPWTQQGYIGLNIGKPDYRNRCGFGPTCEDPNFGWHLYTGGMFNQWFGMEVGYIDMGRADRAGGTTRARGLNLSLVARAPIGPVSVFAKAGGTYGRTRVTADVLSGVSTGKDSGTGVSVGAGVGYDFNPNTSVVLEYARHDFHFAGIGREPVEMTSVGVVYRF